MGSHFNHSDSQENNTLKKIAFLLNSLNMGGAERCAIIVAQALLQYQYSISFVLLRSESNFWSPLPAAINVIDLSVLWKQKKWRALWHRLSLVAQQHDILIGSNILLPTYLAYFLSLRYHCRAIGWVHGPISEINQITPLRFFHQWIGKMVYRRLKNVVFVSAHARESMSRWLGCAAPSDWQVIYNFIPNAHKPDLVQVRQQAPTPLRLLFVGRLSIEKSPLLLIAVVAHLIKSNIPAELTIVGEGPCLPQLLQAIVDLNLKPYIHYMGSQTVIAPYLQAADFLLLTSQFEGCPLVVLEAMQYGLPVIATRVGGLAELLGPLHDTLLAKSDAVSLSQAILIALQNYKALSAAILARSQVFHEKNSIARWQACLDKY